MFLELTHAGLRPTDKWNRGLRNLPLARLFVYVLSDGLDQWFPNGVSGGTTRCVAKLKKIFKLRLIMIINN
jgi:hypothetical protein